MLGSTPDLGCRTLYTDDGHLWGDHLNNWQHSTMYFAFMLSGAIDLLGIKLSLPTGTEQVRTCSHVCCAWNQLGLRVATGRLAMWVHFSVSHCTCTDLCLCIKALSPSGTEQCALKAARAAIWPQYRMPPLQA